MVSRTKRKRTKVAKPRISGALRELRVAWRQLTKSQLIILLAETFVRAPSPIKKMMISVTQKKLRRLSQKSKRKTKTTTKRRKAKSSTTTRKKKSTGKKKTKAQIRAQRLRNLKKARAARKRNLRAR